jgi:hypothetical protein
VRRTAVIVALVLAVMFGTSGSAFAGVTQASGYTYVGSLRCAWGQNWIDSDNGRPLLTSVATMDAWDGQNLCGNHSAIAGANQIAVRQDLMVWNGSAYVLCNQGGWVYNQNASHDDWTQFRWSYRPCSGNMMYGVVWSAVVDQGGDFYGWRKGIPSPPLFVP